VAEYKACIHGLEATLEIWLKKLDIYGDLMLIICQIKRKWQNKDKKKLKPY
jgi:ribonuclease HI